MNLRKYPRNANALAILMLLSLCPVVSLMAQDRGRLLFEIKIYHFNNDTQKTLTQQYLQQAELPALHRLGMHPVGVFEPISPNDTDVTLYELIPFSSFQQFESLSNRLLADSNYLAEASPYLKAPYNAPAYRRMEVILLRAFPKMPGISIPGLTGPKMDRVYELRSYESSGEGYNRNKVSMFNDGGEVSLFRRLGFNAVFYAEVLSGSHMPNLMYMTTFENKEDRDSHWATFSNNMEWKEISGMDKYQHNVIKADMFFLRPLEFSDL
jgi:hypothetical protein